MNWSNWIAHHDVVSLSVHFIVEFVLCIVCAQHQETFEQVHRDANGVAGFLDMITDEVISFPTSEQFVNSEAASKENVEFFGALNSVICLTNWKGL